MAEDSLAIYHGSNPLTYYLDSVGHHQKCVPESQATVGPDRLTGSDSRRHHCVKKARLMTLSLCSVIRSDNNRVS